MFSVFPQLVLMQLFFFGPNAEYTGKTPIPAQAKTSYAVSEAYPQADRLYARLQIFHWWENLDSYSRVEENFIAEVTPKPGADAGKDGGMELKNLNEMFEDEIHDTSWFWPIGSTGAAIQSTNTWLFGGQVRLPDPAHRVRQRLQIFRAKPGDENFGVAAVSRSGSLMLVGLADEVRIGNPLEWSKSAREEGPLADLRHYLAVSFGNPGQWFLTEDGRYVVIVPVDNVQSTSHGFYSEGGDPVPTTRPASLSAVSFGEHNANAFIYDRSERKITACPRKLSFTKIVDAESVNGQLRLLYAGDDPIAKTAEIPELHRTDKISVADSAGHILYEHQVVSLKTYILYAGWNPQKEQIWFRVRDVPCKLINDDIPTEQPDADYHLMVWDHQTNSERQWRLSVDDIKAAIDRYRAGKKGR